VQIDEQGRKERKKCKTLNMMMKKGRWSEREK
jgi:hypothetical protein